MSTLESEGVAGLYRGVIPPLLTAGVKSGSMMFSRALWMKLLRESKFFSSEIEQSRNSRYRILLLSGALTGATVAPLHVVTDLVKIRMQGTTAEATGGLTTLGTARKIILEEGWSALTIGMSAGVLRLSSAFMLLFPLYDGFSNIAGTSTVDGNRPSGPVALFAGSASGMVSWSFSLPWDVVKTSMQMDPKRYPTFSTTIKKIAVCDGITGFFRGYWAVMFRAVVMNASFFWFYELVTANVI